MIGLWHWLTSPATWSGSEGAWALISQHLGYSGVVMGLAALIGIPLGLWVGHSGRGGSAVVNLVNGMRALPTLGLLYAAVLVIGPRLSGSAAFQVPAIGVLVILAVPPVLAGTYSGIDAVPPDAHDAATGMGMTGWQRLWWVEVPCALPLILSGLRSAALQVIATATLAAYVGLGGLGYFLQLGQGARDYPMMAGGSVLVACLALVVDLVLAGVQKLVVSPGLSPESDSSDR